MPLRAITTIRLTALLLATFAAGCSEGTREERVPSGSAEPRPNIVLVVVDDLGIGDIAHHGNPFVKTPNIDRLARESLRFTNFHVDPTCSPTRAAFMTGRHSLRTGVWLTVMGRSLLPTEETTLAEQLRSHGYRTAIFGKWHLGDNFPFRPQDQGFDHVLVHGGGGVGQSPDHWNNTQFDDSYFQNGEPRQFEGYATTVWFDEAIAFMREQRQGPSFVYIATNAPHRPWRAPQRFVDPYLEEGIPEDAAAFYGMVTALDEQVGRLRRELDQLESQRDTILIFTSDNGSALWLSAQDDSMVGDYAFNAGMRGGKGEIYDGGHRVPFFLSAPASLVGEPRDIPALSAHFDLLPTLLDFIGAAAPAGIDGRSLLPLLRGDSTVDERSFVVTHQRRDIPRFGRPHVLMTERWRYVRWAEEDVEELYDVSVDPGQANNVIGRFPDVAADLRQDLADWWEETLPHSLERQRIIVGDDRENPARLNPMDWTRTAENGSTPIAFYPGFGRHRPDIEPKGWIGREHEFRSLPWSLTVAESGHYRVSLYLHDAPANKPIGLPFGVLEIGGERIVQAAAAEATHVTIETRLEAGDTELKAWFSNDADGSKEAAPAMYVYVQRE